MKKALRKTKNVLYHYAGSKKVLGPHARVHNCDSIYGNCSGIIGDSRFINGNVSYLWGPIGNLRGNVSGLIGNCELFMGECTGVSGQLDDCEVTEQTDITECVQ